MNKKELGELLKEVSESLLSENKNGELRKAIRILLLHELLMINQRLPIQGDVDYALDQLFKSLESIKMYDLHGDLPPDKYEQVYNKFMERIKTF